MDQNEITAEKLKKYFDITSRALAKVKIAKPNSIDWDAKAKDFLDMSEMQRISEHAQKPHQQDCKCRYCLGQVVFDMAERYFNDARHFEQKGDIVTAFAALNYAHGWLDAGARLGLFDVDHDDTLFTVE